MLSPWKGSTAPIQIAFQKDLSASLDISKNITSSSDLFWVNDDGSKSQNAEKVYAFIENLTRHGVDVDDILKDFLKLSGSREDNNTFIESLLKKALDRAFGGEHRKLMRQDHPSLIKEWQSQVVIDHIKQDGDIDTILKNLLPNSPHYKGLQHALVHYQNLLKRATDEGDPAFSFKNAFKKNAKLHEDDIKAIKKYLLFYGYLEESAAELSTWDDDAKKALSLFQKHHNEEHDPSVGPRTRALFALTVKDRIQMLAWNMNRLRYMGSNLPHRYILVNVAGYRVDAVENEKIMLSMKAVMGMKSRKTPLFIAPLTHFIFHPTWTVPSGIFEKDKLPRLLNDPDYRERMRSFMKIPEGIDMEDIDWHDRSQRPQLTYPPCRSNPLGKIKFYIKNPFTIYLHDTDQPHLFKSMKRAKSSGCIRLEKPKELTAWLDVSGPYASVDAIDSALKTVKTSWHYLKEEVAVYVVYLTNWVDKEGYLHFSDDPYGYDQKLRDSLLKKQDPKVHKAHSV